MTWTEFKMEVDEQINKKGYDPNLKIHIIDWPSGYDEKNVEVKIIEDEYFITG